MVLRRSNGKSDSINTFESLIKVFVYLFWEKICLQETIYTVAKFVIFWNEGTFVRTAHMQEVGVLLKWNSLTTLGKGLLYVRNLLHLTIKFYFQNQPPKCMVDGYKFRSL